MTEITGLLSEATPKIVAEIQSRVTGTVGHQEAGNQQIRKLVIAHNEKFHDRAVSILNPTQLEWIERERLKGLGLAALLKDNVATALELTDEQRSAILKALQNPQPILPFSGFGVSRTPKDSKEVHESFTERVEAHRKHIEEHRAKQTAGIQNVLTPTQEVRLTEMTEFVFANPDAE